MNTIFTKEINYLSETLNLLKKEVNKFQYDDLKNRVIRRYPNSSEILEQKIDLISSISNKVYTSLSFKEDRLSFFFKHLNQNEICIADLLLLNSNNTLEPLISSRLEYIKSLSYSKKIHEFAVVLGSDDIAGNDKEDISVSSLEDLVTFINELDIAIEDKWNVQLSFLKMDELLDELTEILEASIISLKNYRSDIDTLIHGYSEYWETFIKNINILEYFSTTLKLDLGLDYDKVNISPSLFGCNTIVFSLENKVSEKNTIKIGILYDENMTIEYKPTCNPIEVYQNLKLLGDKSKFDILMYIKDKSAYGQELSKELNLSTSTISHHMSTLINARFVKVEQNLNRIYYSMNKENLKAFLDEVKSILIE